MSSSAEYNSFLSLPTALQYRDIAASAGAEMPGGLDGADRAPLLGGRRRGEAEMPETELAARIRRERADAVAQLEQQLRQEYEQKLASARSLIAAAVKEFENQSEQYFARVEAEVVQLALSIAAKILHREAQVDPLLVATLVRMAVEKMREGSSVTARVSVGCGAEWKRYFAAFPNLARLEVVEDPQVGDQDCILETELGIAHFGLDAQLKEVERGFFDLLALRPVTR